VFGLEIRPIYLNPANGGTYPLLMRELRRGLSRALRMAIFDFARTKTTHQPKHFHSLGRRAVVKAVWEVDRQLAEVSDSFDLLFQATPSNAEHAWDEFQKHDFDRTPLFHYRPLPMDPVLLKRRLFLTPINRVDDQALWHLFREKQDELDRKITMLLDINTRRFVHGSVLVFGRVEDDLMRLAKQLLDRLPPRTRDDSGSGYLDASTFARKARAEIAYYRKRWADLNASVQVRDDFVRGLMVSQGSLLVGKQVCIPTARAEALLQHEVGTHVLTYYNGCAQPLRLLRSGLAGYEALQEGLAVLAEYLVGGLNRPRLRLLAARVLAVRNLVDGASFVDTFRELTQTHRFDRRTAFTVTLRVYRGGGLTKDALYLRGLSRMFQYLREDNPLDPLFIGKIDARHIPLIQELRWRKVLKPAPLVPKYLSRPAVVARLGALREGMTVLDLIERKST
jgi:uncharacterized protein (TIGR02421 family)